MRQDCSEQGYSLIQLSVVMVIIGLIIGGILTGADLYRSAQIRQTIGQYESYVNAVKSFQAKYQCLPGDCSNAIRKGLTPAQGYWIGSGFIPAPADGDVGNDNGIIVDANSVNVAGNDGLHMEGMNYWAFLRSAGMMSFSTSPSYYPMPLSALGHGHWTVWSNVRRVNALYITEQWGGNSALATANCGGEFYCPALSPFEAYQIDEKMDDGLPDPAVLSGYFYVSGATIGKVQAFTGFTGKGQVGSMQAVSSGAPGSNSCIDNTKTPPAYNARVNTPNLCLLQFLVDY